MILQKEKDWWKNASVYQIYPKSFYDSNGDGYGDLEGIRQKLPYIKSLGVDVIWICPYFKSPQADNGYDISDYYTVDSIFGTNEDLRRLVDDCHNMGLKFVMDLVANHTSDEHEWFKKALAGDEHYMNYYYFRDPKEGEEPCNWRSVVGGSAWEYVPGLNKYYLHTFHKKQPDLNWNNKETVDNIIKIMKDWAEFGVDGFRLDAINYLDKDLTFPDVEPMPGSKYGFGTEFYANRPKVNDHFARLNKEVFAPYNMMTVAEVAYIEPQVAREYCGIHRPELDMLYIFDLLNFDQEGYDKFKPLPFDVKAFKQAIFHWQDVVKDFGHLALFFSNHDQARSVSRFGCDSEEYHDLSCKMQGNAMYMLKGTPYIYQGEEIGMTNLDYTDVKDFHDVEVLATYEENVVKNGEPAEKWLKLFNSRSRDCGRSPMQWDGSKNGGFSLGTPWQKTNGNYKSINVRVQENDENSPLNFYKELLRVRKNLKSVQKGIVVPFDIESENTMCYARTFEDETVISVNNFKCVECKVELPQGKFKVLLTNYGDVKEIEKEITLRPYECITAIKE